MRVSIITVSYNSEKTIEQTICSVLGQDYAGIEYIIVDGKSTDGTLSIIDKYRSKITRVISEKDAGMYDALNKGIKAASGEVVGLLHSDDFYPAENIIRKVVEACRNNQSDGVYGDLQYVKRQETEIITRNWKAGQYHDGLFLRGWMPPHPTFFVKREVYFKYGMFDTRLHSAADYELMLRFIHKHKIKLSYIPEVLIKMRVGGKSNISLVNRLKANREDRLAWKLNELKPAPFTLFLKPLSKIRQFF